MSNKIMDIHNHTIWSDGIHKAEEIIENAISHELDIIGISDHFNTTKCNSVQPSDMALYIEGMEKMKERYKGKIEVLSGIEICMNRDWCDLDKLPYEDLNKLDYILFEYIDGFYDSVRLKEIGEYASKITCRKGLAHTNLLNLAKKYGLDVLMKLLKENDLFWELNVNEGYEYFDEIISNKQDRAVVKLFNKLKIYEIEITVGSDTHSLSYYDVNRIISGNELARNGI